MSDFEDKTKLDNEIHLTEKPQAKLRNQLSRKTEPTPPPSSLSHFTPPSRDGKIRKVESAEDKQKKRKTLTMIVVGAVGAILLMNYRVVFGTTYTAMATLDLINHNLDAAALHYKDAYFINSDDVNSLLMAASIHLGQKKEQLAQEEFAEGLKHTKNLWATYNQRAKILNGMGRSQEALADWAEAIKLKPDYFQAHAQRALILMRLEDFEKAVPDLEAAVKYNPHPEDKYYEEQRDYAIKMVAWKKANELRKSGYR